jgi:hypothetical protein
MHPTAETRAVIILHRAGRRVIGGVRLQVECSEGSKEVVMLRNLSRVVGVVALIILRLAAPCPALPQSAATDAERVEVARAVLEAERERQVRAFEHITQLSTENIESLNPAEFAAGFALTLLTPKEIEERAQGFIGAHYLAFKEFNIEGARAVVKLAVTREVTPCFGPYQKHQEEFAYRLERINGAWKAKDATPPFGVKPNIGMHPTADTRVVKF